MTVLLSHIKNNIIFVVSQAYMKLLVYLYISMISILFVGVVGELYEISDVHVCLLDFPDDGNSEKDTSENAEVDAEFNSLNISDDPTVLNQMIRQVNYSYCAKAGHFLEIPDPPPELL